MHKLICHACCWYLWIRVACLRIQTMPCSAFADSIINLFSIVGLLLFTSACAQKSHHTFFHHIWLCCCEADDFWEIKCLAVLLYYTGIQCSTLAITGPIFVQRLLTLPHQPPCDCSWRPTWFFYELLRALCQRTGKNALNVPVTCLLAVAWLCNAWTVFLLVAIRDLHFGSLLGRCSFVCCHRERCFVCVDLDLGSFLPSCPSKPCRSKQYGACCGWCIEGAVCCPQTSMTVVRQIWYLLISALNSAAICLVVKVNLLIFEMQFLNFFRVRQLAMCFMLTVKLFHSCRLTWRAVVRWGWNVVSCRSKTYVVPHYFT